MDGAGSGSGNRPGRTDEVQVVVYSGPETEGGEPIEPEEQHAEVVQPIKTVVTLGHKPMAEDVPLSVDQRVEELARRQTAHIAHQTTAGELAQSVLQRCGNCEHFRTDGWLRAMKRIEESGDKAKWEELNRIRGQLIENLGLNPEMAARHDLDNSGSPDVEHALKSIGVCMAITERDNDLTLVYPLNACAWPDFFKMRKELETRRAAASGYDWIMRSAQGRK